MLAVAVDLELAEALGALLRLLDGAEHVEAHGLGQRAALTNGDLSGGRVSICQS